MHPHSHTLPQQHGLFGRKIPTYYSDMEPMWLAKLQGHIIAIPFYQQNTKSITANTNLKSFFILPSSFFVIPTKRSKWTPAEESIIMDPDNNIGNDNQSKIRLILYPDFVPKG